MKKGGQTPQWLGTERGLDLVKRGGQMTQWLGPELRLDLALVGGHLGGKWVGCGCGSGRDIDCMIQ